MRVRLERVYGRTIATLAAIAKLRLHVVTIASDLYRENRSLAHPHGGERRHWVEANGFECCPYVFIAHHEALSHASGL